jgi:hypothetical protein
MRTGLEVNPDGAIASYTPGDHGYTYILNGVNLLVHGQRVGCSSAENKALCREKWFLAEQGSFRPGTPEFCVFAMDVEPLDPGKSPVACELPRRGRFSVGNGKGRPKVGASIPDITGAQQSTYLSTTTLRHKVNGQAAYVDSAIIPGLVVPTSRGDLVGAVAWVRYNGHEGFAIVNDTGPAFGEGSVALHQLIRTGSIGPIQPIGPIPTQQRCSDVEMALGPPFVSKPEGGKNDRCRSGYKPKGPADIRAYSGIASGVVSIILSNVKPPMDGWTVGEEITPDALAKLANDNGYTAQKLRKMAACLKTTAATNASSGANRSRP